MPQFFKLTLPESESGLTVYHYRLDTARNEPVIATLRAAIERYPRYGFPKLFQILRQQRYPWTHKRVHRINHLLKPRHKGKQRLSVRPTLPLAIPESLNQSSFVGVMHYALVCGHRYLTFNVVDDFNNEMLSIKIDLNLKFH